MVRGLRRFALLGLAGLPAALADAGPADVTCVDNASDQAIYTGASGVTYQILCGVDYAGSDLPATTAATFAGCIDACDSTAGCVDVSYAGESCYLKSQATTPLSRDWVWTAKQITKDAPLSCDNNASDGQTYQATGSSFTITCGKDYAGGDLLGMSTASFEACIQACDSNTECVNVAYVYGACYLKKEQNAAADNAAVWGAVRNIVSTPTSTTAASSTAASTTASSIASSTASSKPLSCENNASNYVKYTTAKNGLYQVMCGVDYGGGDLLGTTTDSFEDCIAACDDNTDCIDVSFVAPSCYLKKTIGDLSKASYVWTAKQLLAPGSVFAFPTATPMDPGTGTEESFDGPLTLEPAPIATLGPVAPPGLNLAGTGVLTPNPVAELWYNGSQSDSDGTDLGPMTVRLNITYNYPTIVLDHSIYISDVVCDSGSLHGRFNTSYPFYYAQDTWKTNDDDVILITSSATCGAETAQNAFFLAHTISFTESSYSFEALGQIVELKDIFADMTVDFGNITVNAAQAEDDACGSPSADNLHGLPAVACGANFDQTLDDKLGYYSSSGADVQAVLDLAAPTSNLQRRGWFSSLVKAVVKVVTVVVKVVVAVVAPIVKAVVAAVVAVAVAVVNVAVAVAKVTVALAVNAVKLIAFAVTGQYSNSLTLPVSIGPPSSVLSDSPWGQAFKMYTFKVGEDDEEFSASKTVLDNMVGDLLGEAEPEPGVELYCVNCGVRGSVKATGTINATPLSGVKQASIGVSGNMYVGLYIGVNAFAKWEKEWEKEIFEKGLPGWSIPGIVTLGPKITLSAKAMIGVEAEGQLLTGASLTWPAFEATLDFAHPSQSSQSGWTPELDHVFQTYGSVTATAALGLPVSLWFGIDILGGLFKEGVALVDTPAITGEASFELSIGTDDTSVGTDECAGIAWDIKLTNEVTLEIDNGPTFHLHDYASPALAEGCIGYTPGSSTPTTDLPTLPTLPPADDGTIKCPQYNNQEYTDDLGNHWMIKCNNDYMYYDTQATWTTTMNDCMSWCAGQANCAGVSWMDNISAGATNCWARSRAGTPRAGQYHSMMLMSPFEITSVVYGVVDVTNYAVTNWQVGNRIEIDTNAIVNRAYAAAQDPLYGTPKSIFILYKYGAESRSWVGVEATGTFTIRPGAISSAPGSSMLLQDWPSPNGNNWIKIVEVAYGKVQNRNRNAWNTLYTNAWNYGTTVIGNDLFTDSWVGTVKSGVVWYRDTRNGADGPLYMVAGKEGSSLKLMRPNGSFSKRSAVAPRLTVSNSTIVSGNSTVPSNTTTSDTQMGQGTATVRDTTGVLELFAANNGNLFVAPVDSAEQLDLLTNGTTLSAITIPDNTETPYMVAGDSLERLLHYFPDEVSSLGASRLRLATWDKLTIGSRLIDLVPITSDTDASTSMLVAVDGEGTYLFPVMCAIENQNNKIFLVKDTSAASLKALEAEDLKFVLTGGVASQCSPLALVATVTDVTLVES